MKPERLKLMREKSGLTQEQVAKHLNVTRGAVGHWERGKNEPSYDVLVELARLYNTTAAYLIGETDDPSPLPISDSDILRADFYEPPPGWDKLTKEQQAHIRQLTRRFEEAIIADLLRDEKDNGQGR